MEKINKTSRSSNTRKEKEAPKNPPTTEEPLKTSKTIKEKEGMMFS